MIQWESSENHLLINPRFSENEQKRLFAILNDVQNLQGHIWLTTSGSTGVSPKWVALSKEAFLISAKAVNKHLQSDHSDIWLNPLPKFHTGGLGIFARAFLSGASVVDFNLISPKWNPELFHQVAHKHQVTLSSLVPAQVFDLVAGKFRGPKSLRGVIVGGSALQESLYTQALELGWKLLPSYGLTECASQVSTASLEGTHFRHLNTLEHMEIGIDKGFIKIKSHALLTGYGIFSGERWEFKDPRVDGWFLTEDKGILNDGVLEVIGRENNFVKIGGESANFSCLENILEEIRLQLKMSQDLALIAMPDERLGHSIHLAVADTDLNGVQPLVSLFQSRVLPFERIRQVHLVKEIPRSPLKKLLRQELLNLVNSG